MRTISLGKWAIFVVLLMAGHWGAATAQDLSEGLAGSDAMALGTQTVYLSDDFESGLGKWIVSGYDWGLTGSTYRSPSHSLTDSPIGDYVPCSDVSATLKGSMDLSGAVAPVLIFWHKGTVPDWADGIEVEVSTNGGTTWTGVRGWNSFERSTWSMEQMDLPAQSNVKIRFRLTSDCNGIVGDGWYIDDLWVGEKDTEQFTFPFSDDFEGGLGKWIVSGYDWELTGSTYRGASHSLTDSRVGEYIPCTDASATLKHPIDLSGATAPVLIFWHKGTVPDWADWVGVEISTDGGTTWPTAATGWGSLEQSTWSMVQVDLPTESSVQIRFRLASDCNDTVGDGWYIDDVWIGEKDTERFPFPFCDGMQNSSKWIWSGHDWGLTGSTYRSPYQSLTDSPVGNYLPCTDASATLKHPIDLSEATDPVLIFWHKGSVPDWADWIGVEVSTDGGTTWPLTAASWSHFVQSTWSMVQVDLPAESSVQIRFRLASDCNGIVGDGWSIDDVCIVEKEPWGTGIDDEDTLPGSSVYALRQNSPNPFNPTTTIEYSIAERGHVTLKIYDTSGRLVRILVDEEQAPQAGGFSKVWNGVNDHGQPVASGVYFYHLTAKSFEQTRKMVFLK